ncbi:MAG: Ankyrin repeat (3 copies) [Gammaproteobacteria bacterium]|jgi:hypothetical protein|nr:Ankyrin repeat (3 copies) [Gammaproteobacteria bacterium]
MPFLRDIFTKAEHIDFIKKAGLELDINYIISSEIKPLIDKAAEYDEVEILEILYDAKIDLCILPNPQKNEVGYTPLTTALGLYSDKVSVFLIEKEIGLDQADEETGEFPLMTATRLGDTKNLLRLIEKGVNINQENLSSAWTNLKDLPYKHANALMYAVSGIRPDPIKLLIAHGAALINSQGTSVLEYCYNDYIKKIVKDQIEIQCLEAKEGYRALTHAFLPPVISRLVNSYMPGYIYQNFFKRKSSFSSPKNLSLHLSSEAPCSKISRSLNSR